MCDSLHCVLSIRNCFILPPPEVASCFPLNRNFSKQASYPNKFPEWPPQKIALPYFPPDYDIATGHCQQVPGRREGTTRGYGHYLSFLLPFSNTQGLSFYGAKKHPLSLLHLFEK